MKTSFGLRTIQGQVTQVLDGNTFTLRLGSETAQEMKLLQNLVTVKLAYSSHLSKNTLGGMLAKLELEKRLAGQRVHCEIVDQDQERGFTALVDFNKLDQGLAIYD